MFSPIAPAPLLPQITPVGGIVLDLVGLNGGRIEAQLPADQLFHGDFASGSPAVDRGNPGTFGVQTGLSANALRSLGGGIAAVSVRVTLQNGDTGPGELNRDRNELLVNGLDLGNFSNIATEQTSSDGQTSLSFNTTGGFRDGTLDTGFFTSTDPGLLASLYQSILDTGRTVYQLRDQTPYDQSFDFTAGLTPDLAHPGPSTVFAINPPIITGVDSVSPIDEGGMSTITVKARTGHENPRNPTPLTYQFDPLDNGTYSVTNTTGSASLAFFQPGTYIVPFRVITPEGAVATGQTSIRVNNVAPSLRDLSNQRAIEGSPQLIPLGRYFDPGSDGPWAVSVDWGDGSSDASYESSQIGSLGQLAHAYELEGNYLVTVHLSDRFGAATGGTFLVQVENVGPTIEDLSATSPIRFGHASALRFRVIDPGMLDSFQVLVSWGDQAIANTSLSAGERLYTSSHTYAVPPGEYTVAVTVTDHGGARATAQTQVLVLASPTISELSSSVPDNPEISTLAFFSSSQKAPPSPGTSYTVKLDQGLGRAAPAQPFGSRPIRDDDGGAPPTPGGRSLEAILAELLKQSPKTTGTGVGGGGSSAASAMRVGARSTQEANQATTGRDSGAGSPGELASSNAGTGGRRRGHGNATRMMMLVVWVLSLRNYRRRTRSVRRGSGENRQSGRQQV
jgi:hypothetical protein